MKKKILLTLFILILLGASITVYLNNVFLPQKIKSLIINNLQEVTQKKVSLDSLQFSFFKGLVLRNIKFYEGQKAIADVKEVSCTFLILPLLDRKIIIPKLKLKQAVILLERKKDNTLNIPILVFPSVSVAPIPPIVPLSTGAPKKEIIVLPAPKAAIAPEKKFSITINSISVKGSRINFQDDTLSPVFTKSFEDINLLLRLSLPSSVRFSLKSQIRSTPAININVAGEYKIPEKVILAKISLQDFSPKEFSVYLKGLGIDTSQGLINALIDLKSKDGILSAEIQAQGNNLAILKENLTTSLTLNSKARLEYNLKDNQIKFSGSSVISDSTVNGLERIGAINNISGNLAFDNSGIWADKLNADILGIPIIAQFQLRDFKNPSVDINIATTLSLDSAQGILKDKLKFSLPASVKGNASLMLGIQGKTLENLEINGYLDIINASVKADKFPYSLEDVFGKVEFSRNQLKWKGLNFKYSGVSYKTSGSLIDFKSPNVQLALNSNDLSFDSRFAVNKNLINLVKFNGKYLNSEFSASGNIDTSAPSRLGVDLKGELNIEAQDLKKLFSKFKNQLEQADLQGEMNAQFSLNGDINDFKSCELQAKIYSSSLSAYGLRSESFSINYSQVNGIADISAGQLSLYGGICNVAARLNLNSQNQPFWATLDFQGVKLEKLKMDTGARQKDIAGVLSSQIKINGFNGDISKLSGEGNIQIADGKLWQLNLFKGLGSLVFAKDFATIVFKEGSCDFLIKDKYIASDNILLKSNIADISGSARVGFDSSLDMVLNVKILDEMAPLSGGFKDLTTAIMGEAGRFGVIKISGTLKEPKYKFKPAVGDIIKGLKNIIFGK